MPVAEIPAQLGPDLWALAARLGAPVVDASILTTLPSPVMTHASFRLRLADGRTFKGRRVETPDQARQIAELLPALDRRHFPRVLARCGSALLEEWIPGTPLVTMVASAAVARRCGRILGQVHTAPPPTAAPAGTSAAAGRLAATERQLARLQDEGALSQGSARQALLQLRDHVPDQVVAGIVHRDFCAENIVLTPAGDIGVIDNETVTIDACEFDLARTWYRWPMTPTRWAAFLAGYGERRPAASFLRHFPFWAVAALVDAALFRIVARTRAPSVPVRRLGALLARLERRREHSVRGPAPGIPPRANREVPPAARGGGPSPPAGGALPGRRPNRASPHTLHAPTFPGS